MPYNYKTIIDNLEDENFLSLRNVREIDCKSLAQALKGSQITSLDLRNNNIGCNDLKYLIQVLRDTQITELYLENNNIMDEGVKYLAECLKDTQITELNLSNNKIGIDAAEYLNKMLSNTKMEYLYLDIYYKNTEDGDVNKYISQTFYGDIKKIHITIHNNKIGIKGAQYLNKNFQNIAVFCALDRPLLEADDAQYLAQAFKDIKIYELEISSNHIRQLNNNSIQYLVEAFKDSHIYKLNIQVDDDDIGTTDARYLAEFLKEVQVLHLDLRQNCIGDDGMKCLAPALEYSHIMYIDLGWNEIEAEGARFLSKILQNSKIISIDLRNNSIGVAGAKYLADGLPNSQVTSINLQSNGIQYAGYKYLLDVADNTNIDRVNVVNNNIEAGLEEGTKLPPYFMPRNTTSIADEICRVFKQLVSLNPISNKFEFIISRKDVDVDIDQYVFLFKTLNDHPNSKVHIFHEMCKDTGTDTDTDTDVYHFDIMNKINEFIATMPNKFNTFFESKLPDLVESFDIYYVNLVKQFDDVKLYDIVENLLLHRILYYVDENQEILHPYIYKMLDKYNMPLYNEQLEPNKKEQIISYYQSHQEIHGVHAQEIIDLLRSESYN